MNARYLVVVLALFSTGCTTFPTVHSPTVPHVVSIGPLNRVESGRHQALIQQVLDKNRDSRPCLTLPGAITCSRIQRV